MQGFKNNEDFRRKNKDFRKFINDNIKYYDNFKDDQQRKGVLCYIGLYFNYLQRVGYLKVLQKRGSLELYKTKSKKEYENRMKSIEKLDKVLFKNTFGIMYKDLLDDKKAEIFNLIKEFVVNELTEELFLKFTQSLNKEYEFFFYLYYEQIMDNKNVRDLKRRDNHFLLNKRKESDKIFRELQTLK